MIPSLMGTSCDKRKKEIERRHLEAARRASTLIPEGELEAFEKPDFKISTASGLLGVEVTELLRPGHTKRPLAVQCDFEQIVEFARETYKRKASATSVGVSVYPSGRENVGGKLEREAMGRALAEFVCLHQSEVSADKPVVDFEDQDQLPEGFFGAIQINLTGNWVSGEVGGVTTLSEIREELTLRINEKNGLLPRYRQNLPGCPVWLLIHSSFAVARGVSIPYGLSERVFPSGFDKVLFFSPLDNNKVLEIRNCA